MVLYCFESIKLQLKQSFVSVIENGGTWPSVALAIIKQFAVKLELDLYNN